LGDDEGADSPAEEDAAAAASIFETPLPDLTAEDSMVSGDNDEDSENALAPSRDAITADALFVGAAAVSPDMTALVAVVIVIIDVELASTFKSGTREGTCKIPGDGGWGSWPSPPPPPGDGNRRSDDG
jgi:hypothetical protein